MRPTAADVLLALKRVRQDAEAAQRRERADKARLRMWHLSGEGLELGRP